MLFVSFTKGPGSFPYVFLITAQVTTLVPLDGTTLGDHRVFVLGGDQEVLNGSATFEVGLNAIPTTDLFDAFTKTLCVGYDNVTLIFNFIGDRLGTCGAPISNLSCRPVMCFLYLVQAHLGYLHLVRAFLRWSFSCWSSSGLLHTVEALWERVFRPHICTCISVSFQI